MRLLIILLFFIGCGYKPSSHLTYKTIGTKIFAVVDVSLSDPQNSVLLKDAINRALYSRFKSSIVKEDLADSKIRVSYQDIDFIPLEYNKNGYVVHYQADIKLKFEFQKDKINDTKIMVGRYSFPIRPSAIISTELRFRAIENSSKKALDKYISYLFSKGYLDNE